MKQIENHIFSGMQKDVSAPKHPVEFIYDGRNVRLTAREKETLLSVTNEKGTVEALDNVYSKPIVVKGKYLGHCLLNQYLVVFSSGVDENKVQHDHITRINLSTMEVKILYEDTTGNFLRPNLHIETLGSYESEAIQKVYWTDGVEQPRLINISPLNDDNIGKYITTYFDFVPTLTLNETVTVEKLLGASGAFAPGVIQYAFTFYNRYGQESNIFYTTPLYYISHADRGASPEDKVDNAFRITISFDKVKDSDLKKFDFIRIYSIQRTSINSTPMCKRVQDIPLNEPVYNSGRSTEMYFAYSTDATPEVYIDGRLLTDWSSASYRETRSVYGNRILCYGFKNEFKDFRIVIPDTVNPYLSRVITFGKNSTEDSIIWITSRKISYQGGARYYILQYADYDIESYQQSVSSSYRYTVFTYTDTGLSGDSIDPTELLYKGGECISAGTIEQKDNTLFLGDINISRPFLQKPLHDAGIVFNDKKLMGNSVGLKPTTRKIYVEQTSAKPYAYGNQLTAYKVVNSGGGWKKQNVSVPCCGFKYGETYRFGVQFQHETGKWSDPFWVDDKTIEGSKPNADGSIITLPAVEGTVSEKLSGVLLANHYKKVRGVVVFPNVQDRTIICQGVVNPTMWTEEHRYDNKDIYAQSSWFFRFKVGNEPSMHNTDGTIAPWCFAGMKNGKKLTNLLPNAHRTIQSKNDEVSYNPEYIRSVEVQGSYDEKHRFILDDKFLTLHSPDAEFDTSFHSMEFLNLTCARVGTATCEYTLSDIDIQTETPTVSNRGGGFVHKAFTEKGPYGIVSGLFYDDFLADDDVDSEHNLGPYPFQKSACKWLVYPWQKNGSLNNDMLTRPADKGVSSATLKQKIISNLRYTKTEYKEGLGSSDLESGVPPQLFSSDVTQMLKLNTPDKDGYRIYQGNVDTLIMPDHTDGAYFCWNSWGWVVDENGSGWGDIEGVETPFDSDKWHKTFSHDDGNDNGIRCWVKSEENRTDLTGPYNGRGWYMYKGEWLFHRDTSHDIGDKYVDLSLSKTGVRMKYKSTPHIVMGVSEPFADDGTNCLPIVELRSETVTNRFGGNSMDALRENVWIPCGEPVSLTGGAVSFEYSWGDTYYQRWDCLKTYAFTPEDPNQIVEIGSFMLETHTNIDGRYDRNRGQKSNLYMSPQNFNLLNPVYSQPNNFFSYRMQDDEFYKNTHHPNQVTWTKGKTSGADVDLWTNITLASISEIDGTKGKVEKIVTWKDLIYCFQNRGICNIMFNSRVQIPTSDGVPIEISNSYKVDGVKYLSDGVGCNNKLLVKKTPNGIYFVDSIGGHLFLLGEGLQDLAASHYMTTWFKDTVESEHPIKKLLYDDVNHDVYAVQDTQALCFSELLNQFTSFYNYGDIDLIETWDRHVFTMWDSRLFKMFEGNYGDLLGYTHDDEKYYGNMRPWSLTFISNGMGNNTYGVDKIFTNLEFRASVDEDGESKKQVVDGKIVDVFTKPYLPFDSLETWNEYQHGIAKLANMKGHDQFRHHTIDNNGTLKRKFRIWRCDIPRDNADSSTNDATLGIFRKTKPRRLDRMRNPWLYLKLQKNAENIMPRTEIHDIVVSYFL